MAVTLFAVLVTMFGRCVSSLSIIPTDKRWKEAVKAKHKFLFPAKAVATVYRAYFLKQLQQQIDKGIVVMREEQRAGWLTLRSLLYNIEWIINFKEPMGGPAQVLEYLGRYTHTTCPELASGKWLSVTIA